MKECLGCATVVTFLGLCKNAGKTTAMAKLMEELGAETLGVTSIGRDGESTDLVTGTQKPSLYLKEGTLFATARGTLSLCDGTYGVEAVTPLTTPLGKISILRTLSHCYVQLAGPSGVDQLPQVVETLRNLGADRVLIDGAASRKSLGKLGGARILCTGASLSTSMEAVVADTAHVWGLFSTSAVANGEIRQKIADGTHPLAFFTMEGQALPCTPHGEIVWKDVPTEPLTLWVAGGVTDRLVQRLSRRGAPTLIITQDPTHLLVERLVWEKFLASGGGVQVMHPLPIALICANPWSAYGGHFPADAFLKALQGAIPCPVINVKGCG